MSDEEELEEIKRRKLEQLRQQAAQQHVAEAQQKEFEAKKYQLMRKILSQEGRQRLENIRIVKPQFAEQIELQLIQLAQAGQLRGQLSDAAFKKLLKQLTGKKKDYKIKNF
ncbi:MAG: DNA-binding protein [Promethearchaeota archaeon]|nr:MAG: DNA-binding protein [Candidatus Lokiarchaeota archaeon]